MRRRSTHSHILAALIAVGILGGPSTFRVGAADSATIRAVAKASEAGAIDETTGLAIDADWELAKAHCGVCHSYRLVTSNRGDRDYWLDMLRWMQRTQNLWPIPADQEAKLLDYLAANYNESEWGRRPPLSPALMPGN